MYIYIHTHTQNTFFIEWGGVNKTNAREKCVYIAVLIQLRRLRAVAQWVEALRYKPEGVAGSIPDGIIGILH
jgi:hypothetical protein